MRDMLRQLEEVLRRVWVMLRCHGQWCQACQLGSHVVPHTCPQKESFSSYLDEEGRLVEFGKIVGAEEGFPHLKPKITRKPRPYIQNSNVQSISEGRKR